MSGQYLSPAAMRSQKIDASVRASALVSDMAVVCGNWAVVCGNCRLTVQTGTHPRAREPEAKAARN